MSDLSNQLSMNMMQVNSQIVSGLNPLTIKKTDTNSSKGIQSIDIKTNNKQVYASKGEYKYDAEMDTDNNGIVTYSEYVKHISEQSFGNTNVKSLYNLTKFQKTTDSDSGLQLLTVYNYGKALRTYINSSAKLPNSMISAEI